MKDLRSHIEELEQELRELRVQAGEPARRPSRWALRIGLLLLVVALAAIFALGYLPRQHRESQIVAEAKDRSAALPVVRVAAVRRSPAVSRLVLPGTTQAITEAPILARADGYLKRRYADIGDRVRPGQLLAEIEAPELDQQALQAGAAVEQTKASLEQAKANNDQARSNEDLARVTAARWGNLLKRGVVSRQENDQLQANYKAQAAGVVASSKALAVAKSNIAAAEANLARVEDLRGYLKVLAPFAGIVTMRNVDAGALVTSGNTLLFRVAQIGVLRTYVNVPQVHAASVRTGMPATLSLADRPGVRYSGRVSRAANALDPATRTMLAEIQVPNPDGSLLPGMYVQVSLEATRKDPPLLLGADALVVRGEGTLVAVVDREERIRFRKITVGRDYGPEVEVVSGIQEGERVVINPSDAVREGVRVKAVRLETEPAAAPKAR
jgi:RND family efflux transporter MFP subunit